MSENDKFTQRLLFLCAIAGVAIAALATLIPGREDRPNGTLALVNGQAILAESANLPAGTELEEAQIQMLIDQTLLRQAAHNVRLAETDAVVANTVETRLLFHQAQIYGLLPVSTEDIERYYRVNGDKLAPARAVHLDLLRLAEDAINIDANDPEGNGMSLVDAVRTALKGGLDFADARQKWGQPIQFSLPRGLTTVENLQRALPPVIVNVAIQLQEGMITDAIRLDDGWYFMHLIKRENHATPDLTALAPQIKSTLEQKALRETRAKLLVQLRENARIELE